MENALKFAAAGAASSEELRAEAGRLLALQREPYQGSAGAELLVWLRKLSESCSAPGAACRGRVNRP